MVHLWRGIICLSLRLGNSFSPSGSTPPRACPRVRASRSTAGGGAGGDDGATAGMRGGRVRRRSRGGGAEGVHFLENAIWTFFQGQILEKSVQMAFSSNGDRSKRAGKGGAETIGSKPYLCVELLSRESAAVSDGSPSLNNQPVNNPTSGIIHLASIG